MTTINADISLNESNEQSNLLQRITEVQNALNEVQNHADKLDDLGYDIKLKNNNGEIEAQIKPL